MRVLVTGGAGFIGSHLVDALLARGDVVRVLDDFSTGTRANLKQCAAHIELVEGDVRDPATMERVAQGCEAVLHEAAIVSVAESFMRPEDTHDVNVGGAANVLHAAREAGVRRVVIASSCAVYGDAHELPIGESAPPAPLSPYAESKLAAEDQCRAACAAKGLDTVSLRYFNVFGPRQDPSSEYSGVIARFMAAAIARRGCTVFGDGLQSRDFVFVGDVVRANLLALDAPVLRGTAINIGTGGRTTLLHIIAELGKLADREMRVTHAESRKGDIRHSQADITRARKLLGYEPAVAFGNGLAATFDWYRQNKRRSRG
jgi:nucleoside-diphosphate-sugar epimerase